MNIDEYQDRTLDTAIYPEKGSASLLALSYLFCKLAGESGELCEKYGKYLRGDYGPLNSVEAKEELRELIAAEAGDVFWYLCRILNEVDVEASICLQANLDKLMDRMERNKLQGDGDNR